MYGMWGMNAGMWECDECLGNKLVNQLMSQLANLKK